MAGSPGGVRYRAHKNNEWWKQHFYCPILFCLCLSQLFLHLSVLLCLYLSALVCTCLHLSVLVCTSLSGWQLIVTNRQYGHGVFCSHSHHHQFDQNSFYLIRVRQLFCDILFLFQEFFHLPMLHNHFLRIILSSELC